MKLSKRLLLMLFVFTTFSAFSQVNLKKTNIVKNNTEQDQVWPLPKFYFLVTIGKINAYFQEVSGLDIEATPIEYKKGNNPVYSVIKMPGIKKFGEVTLKKGIFKVDNKFWEWYNSVKMNTIDRKTITISLLDEAGNPTMTWTLKNAWPTKITSNDLKSDANEVAVETLVITHEGLTINK